MKALVDHGPGQRAWESADDPRSHDAFAAAGEHDALKVVLKA
jgi:hypothetical protein